MKPDRLDDAMLFDWPAFWDSDYVRLMNDREALVYALLLSIQWRDGELPARNELLALRASSGVRSVTPEEFGEIPDPAVGTIWAALKPCFETDGETVWNERVRADREDWIAKKGAWKEQRAAAGRASGEARKEKAKRAAVERNMDGRSTAVAISLNGTATEANSPSPSLSSSPPFPGKSVREDSHAGARAPSKAERDFESWAVNYPNPVKRAKAKASWCRLKAPDRDLAQVDRFLAVAVVSEKWTREDGRYIPGLEPFVNGKIWQDPTSAYPPARDNGNPHLPGSYVFPEVAEETTSVEAYLRLKEHLEWLRTIPESDRDVEETDEDLDRWESNLRHDLASINADSEMMAELRTAMEAT